MYTDRWALDPVSIDASFLDRLRTCFSDQEIVELTYIVMWYAGIHRANAIFDVEPPSGDGGIWVFDESDPEE